LCPWADPRCTKGRYTACGLDARFPCSCSVVVGVDPPLVGVRRCWVGLRRWSLICICKQVAPRTKSRRLLQDLSSRRVVSLCTDAMALSPRPLSLLLGLRNPSHPTKLEGWEKIARLPASVDERWVGEIVEVIESRWDRGPTASFRRNVLRV
jgi:hypothetical protein